VPPLVICARGITRNTKTSTTLLQSYILWNPLFLATQLERSGSCYCLVTPLRPAPAIRTSPCIDIVVQALEAVDGTIAEGRHDQSSGVSGRSCDSLGGQAADKRNKPAIRQPPWQERYRGRHGTRRWIRLPWRCTFKRSWPEHLTLATRPCRCPFTHFYARIHSSSCVIVDSILYITLTSRLLILSRIASLLVLPRIFTLRTLPNLIGTITVKRYITSILSNIGVVGNNAILGVN